MRIVECSRNQATCSRRALVLLLLFPGLVRAAGVVGNGTPGSCSEAALNTALAGGGVVTFSCGGTVTIPITSTKTISAALPTDVDGGGLVTLDGQDAVRIFSVDYQRQLALRNLTLRRGRVADYGAAVRSAYHERGTQALTVWNVRFEDNVCTQAGDDAGGGALYLLWRPDGRRQHVPEEQGRQRRCDRNPRRRRDRPSERPDDPGLPVRRKRDTGPGLELRGDGGRDLRRRGGGRRGTYRAMHLPGQCCSTEGAIHSVMYQSPQALVVLDSTFLENRATGGNGGAIYHQDGSLTFTGSLVAGNRTFSQGGGLWLYHPTAATITNVTFTGNRAEGAVAPSGYAIGGAFSIYPSGANVTLSHLTVTRNHAGWTGGGITVAAPASNVTIRAHRGAQHRRQRWKSLEHREEL
ncbi:MAG: right-handed parallel beta-helix repeat-containing protein [Holophagales bacterium]|nr:right-handed parallel beta-helix repeat-containing protein [Holophagales bacterium]